MCLAKGVVFCPFPVTSLSGTGWPHQAQLVPIQKFCRHQKLPRTPTFDNPDESLKSRQISHNGQYVKQINQTRLISRIVGFRWTDISLANRVEELVSAQPEQEGSP